MTHYNLARMHQRFRWSIPIYNQIDYIAGSSRYTTSVKDAQSWAGCTLPIDHRLVTMDLIAPKQHWYITDNHHNPTIDTEKLTTYRYVQKDFIEYVSSKLPNTPTLKLAGFFLEQFFTRLRKKQLG